MSLVQWDEHWLSQLPNNYADTFQLDSAGTILLIPNGMEVKEVIIFDSKACLDDFVKMDRFPIENAQKTIYELDLEGILHIPSSIPGYLRHVEERFDQSFDQIGPESRSYAFKQLIQKNPELEDKDLLALYMIIAEDIRKRFNAQWLLKKQYGTLNPYYIPIIVDENDNAMEVFNRIESLAESKSENLDILKNDLYWISLSRYRAAKVVLIEPGGFLIEVLELGFLQGFN